MVVITPERLIELAVEANVVCRDGNKLSPAWLDSVDLTPYLEKLAELINKEGR